VSQAGEEGTLRAASEQARQVIGLLVTRGRTLAVAESLTGGMLAAALTAIPGAKEPEGAAKTRFWDALLAAAEARISEPLLFVGDFNTGMPLVDEAGSTFVCAEHFARLAALGWIDVWRHFHGGATEYTWYSQPKGGAPANGFRLDHAFATPSLLPRITACRYSHAEREQKVSDHSPMILEIK